MSVICVSLGAVARALAEAVVATEDLVELRLDLLPLTEAEQAALYGRHARIIATYRGEEGAMVSALEHALSKGAQYIDIDVAVSLATAARLRSAAAAVGATVIVSYHNLTTTPSRKELLSVIETARRNGAQIVKVATLAHTNAEASCLLGLLDGAPDLVVVAMGTYSRLVRAVAGLLGAPWTYAAPEGGAQTAPDQPTVSELRKIMEVLR